MDEIFIKDLSVNGIIGVYEKEREHPQRILVNVRMLTDTHKAALTDDILECVDYGKMIQIIQTLIENSSRFTVEALAEDIANLCLNQTNVEKVIVRVEKPEVFANASSVGVQIER